MKQTQTGSVTRSGKTFIYEVSHAQPWGKDLLECAAKILGADHIIFGTSYPVRAEWLTGGPEFIQQLELTKEEKKQILGEMQEASTGFKNRKFSLIPTVAEKLKTVGIFVDLC